MNQTTNIISLDHRKRGLEPKKSHGATFDGDIETLLDQIGEGFMADDATNLEKLTIARRYGALLIQLKAIVPHGQFKIVLKERFPKVSYAKCNRWMVIARHEVEVADALVAYPDVGWGPKKMIDFLTGDFVPHEEPDEWDEEDLLGCISDDPNHQVSTSVTELKVPNSEEDDEECSDEDDGEYLTKSEKAAEEAELEARSLGVEPAIPVKVGMVTVTVFSDEDHDAIEDALAEWHPKVVSVVRRKSENNLTATVSPEAIPELLMKLGESLRKTLPNQLKVNIEL